MPKEWFIMYRSRRWVAVRPRRWLPMGTGRFSLLTGDLEYVISFKPFRGLCVVEVLRKTWGRAAGDGVLLERRKRPDVKKVKVTQRSSVKNLAMLDSVCFKDLRAVVDALAVLMYEDQTARQPGYLGVWTNGSSWYARITDKDANATLTCEGRTLDEALGLLDMLLGSEDAPWEPIARRKRKSD